jgi:hypothetical protein
MDVLQRGVAAGAFLRGQNFLVSSPDTRPVRPGELAKCKKFEQWAKQVAQKPAPLKPLEPAKRCGNFAFCTGRVSVAPL